MVVRQPHVTAAYSDFPLADIVARSARTRWGAVVLSTVMVQLTLYPPPISTKVPIYLSLVIAAYNLPMMFVRRVPKRFVLFMAIAALVGDFLVCTVWVVLTVNDPNASTYVIYMIVAVEAGVLFRWRGTIGFIAAFVPTFVVFYWFRTVGYHMDFHLENLVFRTSIVSLMAVIVGSLSNSNEMRRREAELAASGAGKEAMRLETVYRVGQRTSASLRRDDVMEAAVSSLARIFPDRWHGIMLLDDAGVLRLAASHGDPDELALPIPAGWPSSTFATMVFDDIWHDRRLVRPGVTPPYKLSRYSSGVITPLGVRDVRFGALVSLDPEIAAFGPDDVKLISALGPQVSTALENARLYEEVEGLSLTDPLTGLGNRRAFDQRLEEEVERAGRYGQQLSLALIDIDHFKIYNDTHGHQAGDEVLRKLGRTFVEHMIRRTDMAFRYGGEEFAVIMPETAPGDAEKALTRLHDAVRTEPLPLGSHQPGGRLTLSAGITSADGVPIDASGLVEQADLALFSAKSDGRNRTVVYDSELAATLTNWTRVLPSLLEHRAFESVYQPIVRLGSRQLVGYEALARPEGQTQIMSIEGLFGAAQRVGRLLDLDWVCYRSAIEDAKALPPGNDLFVNVTLTTLLDPSKDPESLAKVLTANERPIGDVVLEINEREAVTDMERFKLIVDDYRKLGFRFALDDVGQGHSTIEVLAAIEPEFIKIAKDMVVSVGRPGARGAIRGLIEFAATTGAHLIAEGIENETVARQMLELGVEIGQGYALGRPAPLPADAPPQARLSRERRAAPIHGAAGSSA